MFVSKLARGFFMLATVAHIPLAARDIILEFKGAYFHPTGSTFKAVYGKSAALFGPEVTVSFCDAKRIYGFASVDYLKKNGSSVGLCNATTVRMVPLAFGFKYFKPVCCADLYAGLGFQPTHLKTINCSPYVQEYTSQWCLGGIAKFGAYVDVSCNVVFDFFLDYSFVKAGCPKVCQPATGVIVPRRASLSGVIFGAGIGYRFS